MSEFLLTQEVGSLAKPSWRVQPFKGELNPQHIEDAASWAKNLGLDPAEAVTILEEAQEALEIHGEVDPTIGNSIKLLAARYAVRLQEHAGLDIVYDGEQDRPEMYQVAIEGTDGFESRGRVRAFDDKSYEKSAITSQPSPIQPWHTAEFKRLEDLTDRQIKVPITGAYTIAAWSFDEYYAKRPGITPEEARQEFVLDVARNVIRPNIEALLEAGAKWIQIDEPAATTIPSEVPLFVQSFNESVRDLDGKFSVHICFSDYSLLFPYIEEIENCAQFSLEFANKDGSQLGTDKASRPAYEILKNFKRFAPNAGIGLGVTDVHDDKVEDIELVRDRVLRAVEVIGDPSKVFPSPDCGLRTRSWEIAYRKLQSVVEGTQLAKEQL